MIAKKELRRNFKETYNRGRQQWYQEENMSPEMERWL